MNYARIISLQKGYKVTQVQEQINSGMAWKLEGSVGRFAMEMLEAGVCMLPKERKIDYYGNTVPSRDDLKPGTKGTYQNAVNFWQKVWDGDFETIDALEETFGADVEDEVA
jgi:hypothetical protein